MLSLGNSRAPFKELGCWDSLLPSGAEVETFFVKQPLENGAPASLQGRSSSEAENLNMSSKYDTKPLLSIQGKGMRDLIYDFIHNPFKMSWYQYVISGLYVRPK